MAKPAPALPSATVLLVRDRPRFQVLMVQRHHQIEFASGALVFPGGKVEDGDRDEAWHEHAAGWDRYEPAERALRICAVREAYEESGILLATGGTPGAVPADARAEIAAGGAAFREFLGTRGLRIDLAAMTPFAHWITPEPMRKRFDTRFYLMDAPDEQVATADGHETVDAIWIEPREALRMGAAGERTVLFPTRLNLGLLAESLDADGAVEAARARPLRPVMPLMTRGETGTFLTIPADAGYGAIEPQSL